MQLHTRLVDFPPPCESAASQYRVGLIRFESGRVLVFQGGVFGCSSRMRGNLQVRFLEGWAPAMAPGYSTKSLLAAPGDKRTPKLTNVGASNDDLGHPQAASLRHGEDGATSATCFFSAQFEEPVVTRAAQNQITKPVTLPLMPPFAASFFCNCRHLN